ncbi:hypothetical protein AJ88_20800 [Mesorhizobium amorphae CCBAU 01583]|nr:hypothetical protein AJ88_20800 [Mesorhizobium amorphae CCBAU 01583]
MASWSTASTITWPAPKRAHPHRRKDGFTAVREGGPRNVDSYTVRLAVAPLAGQIVYVTISAARSPQQEEDGTLINPAPLPNGIGDTIWLSTLDPGAVGTDGEFQHVITINGVPTIINDRSIVLAFDSTNWDMAQNVYIYAPDDLRAEGDRVVVVQHSVISDTSGVAPAVLAAAYPDGDPFDAADVRNVEVDLRDNDTPGIYVTEVAPGTNTEDRRSLVIEGNATTKLNDELLVQLAKAPEAGDTIVVKLFVNEFSDENIMIYDVDDPNDLDGRMFKGADGYWRITFDSGNWDDAVRVGIEARDDIPREDPHTAAIFFQLDQALTVDADHDYVFPNLRSGPGYVDIDVIDNDSAGAVVLGVKAIRAQRRWIGHRRLYDPPDQGAVDQRARRGTHRRSCGCHQRQRYRGHARLRIRHHWRPQANADIRRQSCLRQRWWPGQGHAGHWCRSRQLRR